MNNQEQQIPMYENLMIPRRTLHFILALALFFFFVAFMIGYFMGVKYATDEFVSQIRQETFAKQFLINTATQQQHTQPSQEAAVTMPETDSAVIGTEVETAPSPAAIEAVQVPTPEPAVHSTASDPVPWYGAELIGFGSKKAAESFIQRVALYNPVKLELKERTHSAKKGRIVRWYQVVTGKYAQKEELQTILDILIKKEHLHDIKVVAYAATKKDLV